MILVREMLDQFVGMVRKTYGVKVILHPDIHGEELGRFMCRSAFFVIRELEDSAPDSETIEVWCNDRSLRDL